MQILEFRGDGMQGKMQGLDRRGPKFFIITVRYKYRQHGRPTGGRQSHSHLIKVFLCEVGIEVLVEIKR